MKLDKPWVKLLKAKYLKGRNLLNATAKPSAAAIWKGIINSIHLLRKGFCFHINFGSSVNIWHDPWIPSLQGFIPLTLLVPPAQHLVVELLILALVSGTEISFCLFLVFPLSTTSKKSTSLPPLLRILLFGLTTQVVNLLSNRPSLQTNLPNFLIL